MRLLKTARIITAEWVPIEANDPNAVQYTTDVMALGGPIQIQYQDGEFRTIYPYGWNTSQDGNVLIMCYKDTGEVRSYRLDRIHQFLFDSEVINMGLNESKEDFQMPGPIIEITDYGEEYPEPQNDLPSGADSFEQMLPQVDNTVDQNSVIESPNQESEEVVQPQLEVSDYGEDELEEENNDKSVATFKIKRLIRKSDTI